ncbi:MAG: 30S ribosomal protein S9 [Planctomycetota bacterium]
MPEKEVYLGTGRRKTSVARVRTRVGKGEIIINSRTLESYFARERDRQSVRLPLKLTERADQFDITAKVEGGGPTGQAGALQLGIARALLKADDGLESTLRDHGLLTRDSRKKERKKYGQPGARRRFQYSKR